MTGHIRTKGSDSKVDLGAWKPLGGDCLTMDGTTQTLGLPSDCSIVEIDAETAEVYYEINDNAASAATTGFVPTNGGRIIGPLAGRFTVSVWGTAADAAVAHIQYFQQV